MAMLERVAPYAPDHEPLRRALQGEGARARALFDRSALPPTERAVRQRLKAHGLWAR